ncbi:DUF58 domain-containing protein [Psychromonas ossibalaenae]|uniref:DUF58 domain-containing protein n=1 Tax=Psychromonas ossibalaenae TaxID=444922 RepID=UPI0003762C88|nr:DUF58 domain-containing protein [Psychromonas ossibalaenae]
MLSKSYFKNLIEARFDVWLKRRLPAVKTITLNRANTFILPSKAGFLYILTVLMLFLLGTNYQNNLILFVVFFLCSFMLTCLLLSYQNLAKLTLTANPVKAQFAGQDCCCSLRISKQNGRAQQVYYEFKKSSSPLQSILSDESVSIYALSKKRGWFEPGRVTVSSRFPFGLFTVWTYIDFGFKCLIYPQPLEKKGVVHTLPGKQTNSGLRSTDSGFEEFAMLKTYLPGESLKSVAWKQVAQGRGMLSKQFEQSQGGDVILDIDDYAFLDLETKLSALCYHVIELYKNNVIFVLKLNDKIITAEHGPAGRASCLQMLALYGAGR